MASRISVTRKPDALTQELWQFWFHESRSELVLDSYHYLIRPTTRHKCRVAKFYLRIDGRQNTLKLEDVPLPDDVAQEAKAAFVQQIVVTKWKER